MMKIDVGTNEKQRDETIGFLMDCMKENLNHCRHIENERLSFASLYMVLAGGVLTIVGGKGGEINRTIVLALLLTIFILGIIALIVTYKWNYVFEGHRECAIACYKQLHEIIFLEKDEPNVIYLRHMEVLKKGLPLYCFKFDGKSKFYKKTRFWFIVFYSVILIAIACVM